MVKKRGIVWNYYIKKVDGSQVIAFCKFCDQSYIQNATRMEKHMEKCPKCPEEVRQQFIQVAHHKKHKASILGMKFQDSWGKHDSSVNHNVPNSELEDLDGWNQQNQFYQDGTSSAMQQNMELVMQEEGQTWPKCENDVENNDPESDPIEEKGWNPNQNDSSEPVATVRPQEPSITIHPRKLHPPRRISQWPFLSHMRNVGYSPLQSKIYQEQLLERRALRKVAELELRRKMLEFERFQWEYERDKMQSELRWAHETRIMQLREEQERQSIEQNRPHGIPHVLQ